jgi:chromosome segregation ATPase
MAAQGGRTVARASEPVSPLVLAAQELEDEIRRCEKAVEEASKTRLNSEKNLGRAAQALKTASETRESIGGKVTALLAAINASRGRMEEVAARMEARAVEIQARMARLETLHAGTAEIGAAIREAAEFAKGAQDARQILERLTPIEERVGRAFEEARKEGFEDVARDVAGMRDMLASMRKKLQSL